MSLRALFALIVCSLVWVMLGCGESAEELGTTDHPYTKLQNQVFYDTYWLDLEVTPNVPNPSFAWHATGLRYVVIVIMRKPIDLKDNSIANIEDVVWTWNTGMGRGREGNVSYEDGVSVENGVFLDVARPLDVGSYYVTAWGYNDEYDLTYSSHEVLHVYDGSAGSAPSGDADAPGM